MENNSAISQGEKPKKCLNCDAELSGRYCAECGQDSKAFRTSLGQLSAEFFKEAADFDSRFFKSLRPLFLQPGQLTMYYLSGKRRSFISPIQLYIFCSFLFFFTLNLPGLKHNKIRFDNAADSIEAKSVAPKQEISNAAESKKIEIDSSSLQINFDDHELDTEADYDSIQLNLAAHERDYWFKRMIKKRILRLQEQSTNNKSAFVKMVADHFEQNLPTMVFLLIPVLAFLLKLLFRKSGFYYVEHLICAVHIYSFAFLSCSLVFFLEWIALKEDELDAYLGAVIALYCYFALKRIYGNGFVKTFLKLTLLLFIFSLCLVLGIGLNILLALLLV